MRKIFAGFLLAVIVGLTAIYFGLPLWANHRAQTEVDAAFSSFQAAMGDARHGKVTYDVWKRTLTIADVTIGADGADTLALKYGLITAKGVRASSANRMEADRIELNDFRLRGLHLVSGGPNATYSAPKIVIENYSGPTTLERSPTAAVGARGILTLLKALAATKVQSISIPTLSATSSSPSTAEGPGRNIAEYGFTNLRAIDCNDGRLGNVTIDHAIVTGSVADVGDYSVEIEKLSASDIDTTAFIPIVDTSKQKDDGYRTIYRTLSSGPYRISFNKMANVRLESTSLENFALRPSVFADPAVLGLGLGMGSLNPASPSDRRAFAGAVARAYEGIRVGKAELRGFEADAAIATSKVKAITLTGLENGRAAEIAVEGVDTQVAPNGPITIGRAAITGVDLSAIARQSADPTQPPSLSMLTMFSGIDIKDVQMRESLSAANVWVESFSAAWDKFIGPVPSQIRVSSRFHTTIDPAATDPVLRYLADQKRQLSVGLELGAVWNEAAHTLVISPVSADIPGLYAVKATLTMNNAPAAITSPDTATLAREMANLEVGRIEASVHDLGGLAILLQEIAREQHTTPDAIRKSMADTARSLAAANPEFQSLSLAIAQAVEKPGSTLRVAAIPRQRLMLGDAVGIGWTVPLALLSQFNIEASAAD
jgi:hypothetical protein